MITYDYLWSFVTMITYDYILTKIAGAARAALPGDYEQKSHVFPKFLSRIQPDPDRHPKRPRPEERSVRSQVSGGWRISDIGVQHTESIENPWKTQS